jgi:hypothetical protein
MLTNRERSFPITVVGSCLLSLGLASCGELPEDDVATESGNLYYKTAKLWGQRDIPVCWADMPDVPAEAVWIQEALRGQRSWSAAGNINFTGWGPCNGATGGIQLTAGDSMVTTYLADGAPAGLATMELDFRNPIGDWDRCDTEAVLSREECLKTTALHEFGHAIGYAHEHNRIPKPDGCTSAAQGNNGTATYGDVADGRAIMAYCSFTTDISPLERHGTDRVYRQRYSDSTRLGDYNGDGRDDLLCHDVVSGDKWIDRASGGQYNGTNWERRMNWCNHDTGRLFKGDFNADGRTDLLCHDVASGEKWIDYANTAGEFGLGDWYRNGNWCGHAAARLFVGDFNGDGRDDLLCHDTGSGKKWIDFADANGQFNGTNWSRDANWCSHATARLFVGDFNGDGRDDMLCHDVADGRKWIDYAAADGTFGGTDWSRAANFCNHDTAELHVGDFNGDGRADILCHDTDNGDKWIDYADASGRFLGADWSAQLGWCNHNAARLFVGDANGDTRDDLVCHDVRTGAKWLLYADTAGAFGASEWSVDIGWCGHDSGELH